MLGTSSTANVEQAIQNMANSLMGLPGPIQRAVDALRETFAGLTPEQIDRFILPWGQMGSGRVQEDIGHLSEGDIENITHVFMGNRPVSQRAKLDWYTNDSFGDPFWMGYTRHGGYGLLTRTSSIGPWLLNLDVGDMVLDRCLDEFRDQVMIVARVVKECHGIDVQILPIGTVALYRGIVGQDGRLSAGRNKRDAVRDTTHVVDVQGREAVFRITVDGQHEFYLSGYDTQEMPPLYFVCRLPGEVSTVEEGRESLKPDSVKKAESLGMVVKRQGDLFAIRTNLTHANMVDSGAKLIPYGKLYGTAHVANLVARLPDGREFATGSLVHDPGVLGETRPPDHSECALDENWWAIAPNTVPKEAGASRPRQSW